MIPLFAYELLSLCSIYEKCRTTKKVFFLIGTLLMLHVMNSWGKKSVSDTVNFGRIFLCNGFDLHAY